MILNVTYNKSTGSITLVDDEELMEATVNESSLVDNENELSIEISLNVSSYQTQFEKIEVDGDDN
mgnify:CR=1 FL=1|tara:strand:- start:29 stop:223 length:195 start_codon:yes stop_codon:yes gene_type:complete